MERLTKRGGLNFADKNLSLVDECGYSHIYKRLAMYEDGEENGTILRLPCKVGDKLYKVMHVCGVRRIVEFEVCRISILQKDICIYYTKSKGGFGNEWCSKPRHIGENIFLSYEKAEKRLKELQKK